MALTYSSMLELGSQIPKFKLLNTINQEIFISDQLSNGKVSLIMFICNHCPFVIHYHEKLVEIITEFQDQINIIAISSNDINQYPQDAPENMQKLWSRLGLQCPYLFDETQAIAKAFKAECTPEFYLFNKDQKLFYRGRFDSSTPGSQIKVTGSDLQNAIIKIMNNDNPPEGQMPSMGCNIKWKISN
ncbi:MAG: thioredoxin family protein [Rickettsiales bacterium]|nr:thioredoxin family protein [Rickettsiales bacterium]